MTLLIYYFLFNFRQGRTIAFCNWEGGRQNKDLRALLCLPPPWSISPFPPAREQNYNRGGGANICDF